MTAPPVEPGTVLGGKFRVEKVLGHGGMGVVVAAHHLQLDERVALKFLLAESLANKDVVTRFEREARAAFKIKSEHVARISDVGFLDTGAPYMVMEYLNGKDLSALLEDGPLPLEDVADYLLQACEAVAEAHSIGIVHRDLKPANLFLVNRPDGSPCVKVLDFGISKVSGLSASTGDHGMTKTNAVMGSPLYMSPEQLASARDVDMRADVWAMGVILFELLTGRHPFEAETLPQLIALIVSGQPQRLNVVRPDLPPAVDTLVMACLQKDRGVRVPTIAEFAMRLVEFAPRRSRVSAERISRLAHVSGLSASALALPPSSEPEKVRVPTGGTIAGLGGTIPQAAGPRRILAATALGLVLVSVAVGLLIGRRQTAEHAETPTTNAAQAAAPAQALPAAPPKTIETAHAPAPVETVVSPPEPSTAPSVIAAAPPVAATRTPKKTSATTSRPAGAPASRPPAASATPVRSTSAYDDRK